MANTNTTFTPIKTLFDTFKIILCNRDHNKIGTIQNVDFSSIHLKGEMVNGNEVSFDVYYTLDDEVEKLWDDIVDFKLIYIPEIDDFLEITITDYDSEQKKKSIVGVSAGIAELSQTQLYGLEINTPADILNDAGYHRTIFYDRDDPKGSLLDRVLYKIPQYTIGHVPVSVAAMQRTFSVNDKSVWEFLSKDVAEAFNVIFVIDNVNKIINVYDLLVVCNECQKRQQPHYEYGYYDDYALLNDSDSNILINSDNEGLVGDDKITAYKRLVCEDCGSHDLDYFGEDTTVIVKKDNLTDEIQLTIDTDSIKNTFKLEGGDDNMTAAIVALNPNGSAYINKFSELDIDDMPNMLVNKLRKYNLLYDSYKDEYTTLMENYYNAIDNMLKYRSGLMPSEPQQTITAATEAAKLTVNNLSPAALVRVGSGTSVASVNNALVQLAKVFVKTGYVKVEVDMKDSPATFTYAGLDANNHNYGYWSGRFLVTSYSDNDDTAYSQRITILISDDYEVYLDQKIAKNIVRYDDKEGSIYEVLKITNLNDFTNALTYYCVNRLISFRDAISNCLNILVQEGHGSHTTGSDVVDEFYDDIYVPYHEKLLAVEREIPRRQSGLEIDGSPCMFNDGYGEPYATANVDYWKNMIGIMDDGSVLPNSLEARKREIQDILNLEKYIGEYYYKIYCAYRREETYSNSNYISNGLDNAEIFANAKEFLEAANEELLKASTPQYTIKCNLFNLISAENYEHIKDKFVLGNWIRVEADNQIFRLRILSYSLDFSNIGTVDVEFSNVTKIGDIMTDVESILKSAKSMATSYGATTNKASAGEDANNNLDEFTKTGLLSALTNVKNNVDEEVTFGKFGIYAKSYDPDTQSYSPEQLRITHNILVFSDDNWQTAKAALGKHDFVYYDPDDDEYKTDTKYGLTAEFVQAGHISGSSIIGGDIYSENYSETGNVGTHINLNNGTFKFGGNKLTFDGTNLTLNNGNITASNITGATINNGNGTFVVSANGSVTARDITLYNGVSSGGTISGSQITGSTFNSTNGNFRVESDGKMYCTGAEINGLINNGNGTFRVDLSGNLTAKSGTIGGWNINDGYLSGTNGNVRLSQNGDIYCSIDNSTKWAIYNNGSATFSNIHATGGTFENVTITGYATITDLNQMNLTLTGQLTAAYGEIGVLNADKANINDLGVRDLETGKITVNDSINAQNATIAGNLDVNGSIEAKQLHAGTVNGHRVEWQRILYTSGVAYRYLYQSNSDKTITLSTQPSLSGYTRIGEVVTNSYPRYLYIMAEDTTAE